jgi:hypothetical protein
MIESYGLNDQPACVHLHINERAIQRPMEIAENLAVNERVRLQINTPASQTRTAQFRDRIWI